MFRFLGLFAVIPQGRYGYLSGFNSPAAHGDYLSQVIKGKGFVMIEGMFRLPDSEAYPAVAVMAKPWNSYDVVRVSRDTLEAICEDSEDMRLEWDSDIASVMVLDAGEWVLGSELHPGDDGNYCLEGWATVLEG